MSDFSDFSEDEVSTPRDSHVQRVIRSRYTGPKNNHGQPDTTGTDEIGIMKYPAKHHYVSYSGQWKNGEFEGHGTVMFKCGDTYTGSFKNSELNGRGVYTFLDGQVLDGEFVDDVIAKGTHIGPIYTFKGAFMKGKMHTGKIVEIDGTVFEGTMVTPNKRIGTYTYPDGDVYFGTFDFVRGLGWLLNGPGEMIINSMPVKFTYRGNFKNSVRHGNGTVMTKRENYSAKFNNDVVIQGTKRPIHPPKSVDSDDSESNGGGGARHKKTVCRHRHKISGSKKKRT